MVSRRLLVVLVLSASLCALALSAPASSLAAGGVPQGFVGTNVDGPLYPVPAPGVNLPSQFDAMVSNGVQSIRAVFNWSWAQPYRSFSQVPAAQKSQFTDIGGVPTRFSELDQIVGLAAQRGLSVLPTLLYAPAWDGQRQTAYLAIPKSNRPFGNFVKTLVQRYGPHGSFWRTQPRKVPIRTWQIWNEPNERGYWPIQPFARSYVGLLRVASAAIKSADPGAKVVLAGLSNYSWQYLAQIYKVSGARKQFDVVGIHPYTAKPQGVITILNHARQVMNRNGDKHTPILADEMGWPSSVGQTSFTYGFETTEAGQATNVAAVLPQLGKARKRLGLLGFYYYTWAGVEAPNAYTFAFSGLERFSGGMFVAKLALGAFRQGALALEGCRTKGNRATICRH